MRPNHPSRGTSVGSALSALLLTAATLVPLLPADALAHGSCTAARMRNIGVRCRAIARCYVADALGKKDLTACIDLELQRLERHFHNSLIYPDCHPFGDPPDVITGLQTNLASAAGVVQLGTDKCSRKKMEAAGKLCLRLLRNCEAPAEIADVPVELACVAEEAQWLASVFDKAEAKGTCLTMDDEAAVQTAVQDAVGAAVTELNVP
jgi:hypothetical protein